MYLLRVGVARQVTVPGLVCGHCAEGAILGLPVGVVRPRDTAFGKMSPFLPDPDKLIWHAIRQRSEERGIDNAEQSDIGADPYPQRKNCRKRKASVLDQRTGSKPAILGKASERHASSIKAGTGSRVK